MNAIKTTASNIWNAIKTSIVNFVTGIYTSVRDKFNSLKNSVSTIFNAIKTSATSIWQRITSSITSTVESFKSKIKSKFEEIGSNIKSVFTGLVDKAKTWAHDMLDNFIQGIKDKISAVKEAFNSVGQEGKDTLGHSHPKKGPMADDYKWMPDMMTLFAKGIKDNAHKVESAVDNVATDISVGLNGNNANQLAATSSLGSSLGELIDTGAVYEAIKEGMESANIGIELDGREFGRTLRGLGVSLS